MIIIIIILLVIIAFAVAPDFMRGALVLALWLAGLAVAGGLLFGGGYWINENLSQVTDFGSGEIITAALSIGLVWWIIADYKKNAS